MEAIRTTLAALLGATATVMAISVGVVSVIPALLELVRTYNADYFISETCVIDSAATYGSSPIQFGSWVWFS